MLNIYYGSEELNKAKFLFEKIKEDRGDNQREETILIVPNQFTVEGERLAFRYMGEKSLMDLNVMTFNRLATRLKNLIGGEKKTFITATGRAMLLRKILMEQEENLRIFKGKTLGGNFISEMNEFFGNLKSYGITPPDIEELAEKETEDRILKGKLEDLALVYSSYSDFISGKFLDTDDYSKEFVKNVQLWKEGKDTNIWIYGYDSIVPKDREVLRSLLKKCKSVNVVLSSNMPCFSLEDLDRTDIFYAPKRLMSQLISLGKEEELLGSVYKIPKIYIEQDRNFDIANLEKGLFADGERRTNEHAQKTLEDEGQKKEKKITVVEASNGYFEGESAASFILHLLRDKGYRYGDIMVVCNDEDKLSSVVERVFFEYGIRYFADRKWDIDSQPLVALVLALSDISSKGYVKRSIFSGLKSGLLGLAREDIEKLEIYTTNYNIVFGKWGEAFTKGSFEYSQEDMDSLEKSRQDVVRLFGTFMERSKEAKTVYDFVKILYTYLLEDLNILTIMEAEEKGQEEGGYFDTSQITRQIWNGISDYFDQMVELIGGEPYRAEEFNQLLKAGFSQISIGLIPPSSDDIIVGSLPRTRSGQVKAVLFLGFNEGTVPQDGKDATIFTKTELSRLEDRGKSLCTSQVEAEQEELLSIYRTLCSPLEHLYISYSTGDSEGKSIRPSYILEDIRRAVGYIEVEKDVVNAGSTLKLLGGKMNTLRHFTNWQKDKSKWDGRNTAVWHEVERIYREANNPNYRIIQQMIERKEDEHLIGKDLATSLFANGSDQLKLSPSRVENYSRCPFNYFISYGIRPREDAVYQASFREIGDIYHEALMEMSKKLSDDGTWGSVDEGMLYKILEDIVIPTAHSYKDGVFVYSKADAYKVKRVLENIFITALALVKHYRLGHIDTSLFEEEFKEQDRPLSPILFEDENCLITGKIDRVDYLPSGNVKIIDYKTGNVEYKKEEIEAGYTLQLMIYLDAATKERKPAGVFYFKIKDPKEDLSKKNSLERSTKGTAITFDSQLLDDFKMTGVIVDDDTNIEDIAGRLASGEKSSVVSLSKTQKGEYSKTAVKKLLMNPEEFEELRQLARSHVSKAISSMKAGRVEADPLVLKDKDPCKYCLSKDVCGRE